MNRATGRKATTDLCSFIGVSNSIGQNSGSLIERSAALGGRSRSIFTKTCFSYWLTECLRLLSGFEHAVETAQHRHGQHDTFVLRRAIWAAQQIRDLPDEIGKLVMIGRCAKLPKCGCVGNIRANAPRLAIERRSFWHVECRQEATCVSGTEAQTYD